jgi:hypothetical protein
LWERYAVKVEDKHHIFFGWNVSAVVWDRLSLNNVSSLSDVNAWNAEMPANLDARLWPFVLQTVLWRLWDARNGEIFRNEASSACSVISKVCDDFVTWWCRLKNEQDVISLDAWCNRFLSCNTEP